MNLSIFIANRNLTELESMKKMLIESERFRIIGCASDGKEALDKISQMQHFNILVLDMILPNLNAFQILLKLKEIPTVIDCIVCTSNFVTNNTLHYLYTQSINDFILKPFTKETFINTLLQVSDKKTHTIFESTYQIYDYANKNLPKSINNIERRIYEHLNRVKIPVNMKGFNYLKIALELTYTDIDFLGKAHKKIYPHIAQSFKVNLSSVERAIRYAITKAWSCHQKDDLSKIASFYGENLLTRPTTLKFLSSVTTQMLIEDREEILKKD